MKAVTVYYRDPEIRRGPYRVLPFTPGGFVIIDERISPFQRGARNIVSHHDWLDDARIAIAHLPLPADGGGEC